jgi:subtilisin family serine protease
MVRPREACALVLALLAVGTSARTAKAGGHPDGAALIRLLGPHAALALSPTGSESTLEALVRLPLGTSAESLGIDPVVPGFGRVRGGSTAILAFSTAHPTLAVEVAPPLHSLLDQAGLTINATLVHQDPGSLGDGVLVGVADTGLDITHADFRDANGNTRIAWLIDMSQPPVGTYPDLEQKYGVLDASGNVVSGAVYAAADINAILQAEGVGPGDDVGHGTHVTSIAAGNGGISLPVRSPYIGVAPNAGIVFARVTRDETDSIDNGDLQRGTQFLFDRADFMQKPIAVNLSLGSDFGPHDGTTAWEEVLASYVGPTMPGHALSAAAGNSGSIVDSPVHESAAVVGGSHISIPIATQGAQNGALQVWVAFRSGASISVGLDGPDGPWIAPQPNGEEAGKNTSGYNAAVINGSRAANSPVPTDSSGAVVVITGTWPSGQYNVTIQGEGTADLYLEGTGDVTIGGNAGFVFPVREGTVNLPATSPGIIGVGCTVNKAKWVSIDGISESEGVPVLDPSGGYAEPDPNDPGYPLERPLAAGDVCWFSSAGPTLTGAQKPEIAAPGAIVVAAMSREAAPGGINSIFTTDCPAKDGADAGTLCLQVDATHAVSQGTSMSSPMVAGTIAILFEHDPTLTQDKILGLLQAGAHPFRGSAPFDDQSGPGELDVKGALDALAQSQAGELLLPDIPSSWVTLSADYVAADGSTPVTTIIELRTTDGAHRADLFDPQRLQPIYAINGAPQPPPTMVRRAPGVWFFTVQPDAGHGGSTMTLGATFDGVPIGTPRSLPIAVDVWRSEYSSQAKGGCAVAPGVGERDDRVSFVALFAACIALRRTRLRSRKN